MRESTMKETAILFLIFGCVGTLVMESQNGTCLKEIQANSKYDAESECSSKMSGKLNIYVVVTEAFMIVKKMQISVLWLGFTKPSPSNQSMCKLLSVSETNDENITVVNCKEVINATFLCKTSSDCPSNPQVTKIQFTPDISNNGTIPIAITTPKKAILQWSYPSTFLTPTHSHDFKKEKGKHRYINLYIVVPFCVVLLLMLLCIIHLLLRKSRKCVKPKETEEVNFEIHTKEQCTQTEEIRANEPLMNVVVGTSYSEYSTIDEHVRANQNTDVCGSLYLTPEATDLVGCKSSSMPASDHDEMISDITPDPEIEAPAVHYFELRKSATDKSDVDFAKTEETAAAVYNIMDKSSGDSLSEQDLNELQKKDDDEQLEICGYPYLDPVAAVPLPEEHNLEVCTSIYNEPDALVLGPAPSAMPASGPDEIISDSTPFPEIQAAAVHDEIISDITPDPEMEAHAVHYFDLEKLATGKTDVDTARSEEAAVYNIPEESSGESLSEKDLKKWQKEDDEQSENEDISI